MKTVTMDRDFDCPTGPHSLVHYKAGKTYPDRPEAQVQAIVIAGAGRVTGGRQEPAQPRQNMDVTEAIRAAESEPTASQKPRRGHGRR